MEKTMETTTIGSIGNNEGMEKNMETIMTGSIGTTIRIHPSLTKSQFKAPNSSGLCSDH